MKCIACNSSIVIVYQVQYIVYYDDHMSFSDYSRGGNGL